MDEVCSVCCFGDGDSFAYDPNPNSYNDSPNFSDYPPQPQYDTYFCELCGNDAHYGYDCPPQVPFVYDQDPCFYQNFDNNFPKTSPKKQASKVSSQYWKPLIFYDDDDDDDEESSIPLSDIISELPLSHYFNAESDLIECMLNRDTLIVSTPKFDSLLEEFSDELAHINLISPGIDKADFDPEEEICLIDDSLMEEIDIFLALDDSIPPGIENDDSEGDIHEELLNNDSLSLPENESFHFDHYFDPSSPRPPAKSPDDDEIYFDAELDIGILTSKVVDDIFERYVLKPRILPSD
ncbi:hypothetical protein Tco_1451161 [Tanacetum coccineum]